MAYGTYTQSGSTYFSNAIPGIAQGINDASIFDNDSTAKFALGTMFKRQDGAIFRYANSITGVVPHLLLSSNALNLNIAHATSLVVLGTSAVQQGSDPIGVYPSYVGSRYVLITKATTKKDQWAGGYLSITRGTGAPAVYRIKGNTAAATLISASQVLIELYEPLVATLAASTTTYLSITASLYNYLELSQYNAAAATLPNIVVGVAGAANTVTDNTFGIGANKYGWIQTRGVCPVLADGTLTAGCMVQASIAVSGAVSQYGVGTTSNASNTLFVCQPVGYCIDPAATTYYATIMLELE